jgi:hypothetical protein
LGTRTTLLVRAGNLTTSFRDLRKWSRPAMVVKMHLWVSNTPLGSPVVPLVYIIVERSSPAGGAKSTGLFAP